MIKNISITLLILTASLSLNAQNTGETSTISLISTVLQEEKTIQIYLPADYKDSNKKYAVLYVIDSQRYFLNGVAFQQTLAWQNVVPEFIVVGVVTDNNKRRPLFYDESRKFIQFLEKELIPKIDSDLAMAKFPDNVQLSNVKGNHYKAIGNVQEAKAWVEKAIEIAKKNSDPQLEVYQANLKEL